MKKTIYVVTGAAGHLGSHVVDALLNKGCDVRTFLLQGETIPNRECEDRSRLSEYFGDVRDRASLEPLFLNTEDTDVNFIHCAGIISISEKIEPRVHEVNVIGTQNVIDACLTHQVKRLVYVSSVHAIPLLPHGETMHEVTSFDPAKVHGQYAKSKAEATQHVLDAGKRGLDVVVVHPAGIIGPGGLEAGNIPYMLERFANGHFHIAVRGGFDFVDVRDVAEGVLLATEKGVNGSCYILSNRFIDLQELFDTFADVGHVKRIKLYLPLGFVKAVAPLAELYYRWARKTPLFTRYSLKTLSGNALYSHEKASQELGYKTRDLRETMRYIATALRAKPDMTTDEQAV